MNPEQRTRMIERFHKRKLAAGARLTKSDATNDDRMEHELCACVVLVLLYSGGVRTCNRSSARVRREWTRLSGGVCGND